MGVVLVSKLGFEWLFYVSDEIALRIITFMFNRPLRDDFSPKTKKPPIRRPDRTINSVKY